MSSDGSKFCQEYIFHCACHEGIKVVEVYLHSCRESVYQFLTRAVSPANLILFYFISLLLVTSANYKVPFFLHPTVTSFIIRPFSETPLKSQL